MNYANDFQNCDIHRIWVTGSGVRVELALLKLIDTFKIFFCQHFYLRNKASYLQYYEVIIIDGAESNPIKPEGDLTTPEP